MGVTFVTYGDVTVASSRFRVYWPSTYLDNVRIVRGETLREAPRDDVVVWQKFARADWMEPGARHIWDVCDPAWWWQPDECRAIIARCERVTVSNDALGADLRAWYGDDLTITTIPDGLMPAHYRFQRVHDNSGPVRFIWFGNSVNRFALLGAVPLLERLAANGYKVGLTIMDNEPQSTWPSKFVHIHHVRWDLQRESQELAEHDIALLPPFPGQWGRVKSNNRRVAARMAGLAIDPGLNYADMERLMDAPARWANLAAHEHLLEYTSERSARGWKEVIHANVSLSV